MKFVDLMILVLRAYAETLNALATRIGEDMVIELLERMDDLDLPEGWIGLQPAMVPPGTKTLGEDASDAMAQLESSVETIGLPINLRFYTWSFPVYRFFAEGPFDLSTQLPKSPETRALIDAIFQACQTWSSRFPVTDQARLTFDPICREVWLKLRAQAYKNLGVSLLR